MSEFRTIDPEILLQLRQGANPLDFDLERADLRGVDYLRGVNLAGANLRGVNLRGTFLQYIHLEGAHLEGAHLEDAILTYAHLEGAHLEGAHLDDAHLNYAHLEGAHLDDAVLKDANLRFAYLEGADFTGARLMGARLMGVRDADFTGAIFEETQTNKDRKRIREEIDESMKLAAKKAKEEENDDEKQPFPECSICYEPLNNIDGPGPSEKCLDNCNDVISVCSSNHLFHRGCILNTCNNRVNRYNQMNLQIGFDSYANIKEKCPLCNQPFAQKTGEVDENGKPKYERIPCRQFETIKRVETEDILNLEGGKRRRRKTRRRRKSTKRRKSIKRRKTKKRRK